MQITLIFSEKSDYLLISKIKGCILYVNIDRGAVLKMKNNTNVKYNSLESFVSTINDLGIELIIDESLRNVRKQQLEYLIDHALKNKNEQDFKRYTEEYRNLEEFLVG